MIGAYDYEEVTVTTGTAVGLTASKVTNMMNADARVEILVTGYPVAYRKDGGTPTSATKQIAQVGDIIVCKYRMDAANFLAIGIGGTAYLCATYYKRM